MFFCVLLFFYFFVVFVFRFETSVAAHILLHPTTQFSTLQPFDWYKHICIQYSKYKIFTVLSVLSLRFSLISFEFIAYLFILLIVIGLFVFHTPAIRKELCRIYFFPSHFPLEIVNFCIHFF